MIGGDRPGRRDTPSLSLEEVRSMMESWQWEFVFHSIYALGGCLDRETWRMTKGEVVSMALERGSNMQWRYADQRGYDLETRDRSVRVEVKSAKQIFLKDWRGQPRNTLKNEIQLKNTRGKRQIHNWNQTFDYLLLVQTDPPYIASIVPWEVVNQNINIPEKGDQVKIEVLKEEQMAFITPINGLEVGFEIEENKIKDRWYRISGNSRIKGYNLRRMMVEQIGIYLDEVERIS